MNPFDQFPPDYWNKAEKSIKEIVENPEFWDNWAKPSDRYLLISSLHIIENDMYRTVGTVSAYCHFFVGNDSIENLELIWNCEFFQQRFGTTTQHFIVDLEEKKVVKFLSICS